MDKYEGHTSGPWAMKEELTTVGSVFKINEPWNLSDKHGVIACAYNDHTTLNKRSGREHEANARLIADAPDLLEENTRIHKALDFLIDTQGDRMTTEEWATYDALITKEEE